MCCASRHKYLTGEGTLCKSVFFRNIYHNTSEKEMFYVISKHVQLQEWRK